jgi:acetoin utilization protein AcuB
VNSAEGREVFMDIMMTIAKIMTPAPVMVEPNAPLREVRRLMAKHRIRHIPVVSGDGLVGIVTDRDIQEALPSPADPAGATEFAAAMDRIAAWEVMTEQVITVTPQTPLAEAAQLLAKRKIGCLPVMERGRLVGIVTGTDMLQALTSVLDKIAGSPQLEVTVADAPGRVCEVSRLCADLPPHVGVFVLARTEPMGPDGSGDRALVLGFHQALEPREIIRVLEAAGIRVLSFKVPQPDRATRRESR